MILDHQRPAVHKDANVNYEKLGKAVEDALILDYIYVLHSTRRQIWSSFVRGVFAGFGGVLGATVGVAVFLALLRLFVDAPVIGRFIEDLGRIIQGTH
jgi:hypothetical protein